MQGPRIGFEGGQTPLYRRIPKIGFSNYTQKELDYVNLGKLQQWIDLGRIPTDRVITMKDLVDSQLVKSVKYGIKILADGKEKFHSAIKIDCTCASKEAIETIEKNGGTIICSHYNRLALRLLLKPEKFMVPYPRRARPNPTDMEFYNKYENRGYLSPELCQTYQEFVKDMQSHGFVVSPDENGKILTNYQEQKI